MRILVKYRGDSERETLTECEDYRWARLDNGQVLLEATDDHDRVVFNAPLEVIRSADYDYDE